MSESIDINELLAGYLWGGGEERFANMWKIFVLMEKAGLVILDEWVERRVRSWCEDDIVVWWGAGSCGKTRVGASLVLWD